MKKDPPDVLAELIGRLRKHLPAYVSGATDWNPRFALGDQSATELEATFGRVPLRVDAWRQWARERDVELITATRRLHGANHEVPTHLVVPDVDTAARLCADPWPAALDRTRERSTVIAAQFPRLTEPAQLTGALAQVASLSDVDFALAVRAGTWFAAAGDTSRLTPRQVPLEGTHAKWLQKNTRAVALLAGLPTLELAARHPSRVHFTYLDPAHRAAGGRRHDSVTLGDRLPLPYVPRLVVISENKDTAIHFPPTSQAVAVEGDGSAAGTLAAVDFIAAADVVAYWGDIDADGFEILNQLRACGLPVASVLMDAGTYSHYELYGTSTDKNGQPLTARPPKDTPFLTASERELYEQICSGSHTGHRRIEQERIPLSVAAAAVIGLVEAAQGRVG